MVVRIFDLQAKNTFGARAERARLLGNAVFLAVFARFVGLSALAAL
jgi:hypothetical protein